MLYTLMNSPYACDLRALLRATSCGDDLVLLADGVIAGLNNSPALQEISTYCLTLHALENDIAARGLFPYFSYKITIMNYIQFVTLTEKQSKQIMW